MKPKVQILLRPTKKISELLFKITKPLHQFPKLRLIHWDIDLIWVKWILHKPIYPFQIGLSFLAALFNTKERRGDLISMICLRGVRRADIYLTKHCIFFTELKYPSMSTWFRKGLVVWYGGIDRRGVQVSMICQRKSWIVEIYGKKYDLYRTDRE